MFKVVLAGLRSDAVRLCLTCLSIVLGIAFVTGTFMLTDSINQAFDHGYARAAENVDAAVQQTGSAVYTNNTAPPTLPTLLTPALLREVGQTPGVAAAAGRLKAPAPLLDANGVAMRTDGLTGSAIAFPADPALAPGSLVQGTLPDGPDQAVVDQDTVAERKLVIGQDLRVVGADGHPRTFRMVGVVVFGVDNRANGYTLVGLSPDVALALTGRSGYDQVDARAGTGVSQRRLADDIQKTLGSATGATVLAGPQPKSPGTGPISPPSLDVLTGAQFTTAVLEHRAPIAGNIAEILQVFGAVALLVAAFVIYNTFTILLTQRIRQVALLRCVGASRRQIFTSTVAEAALVGLIGSALGVVGGIGVAVELRALVKTLSTAKFPPGSIVVHGSIVILGLAVGFLVTVVSSLLPARAATRIPPIEALRAQPELSAGHGRVGRARMGSAAVLAATGIVLTVLGTHSTNLFTGVKLIGAGGALVFTAVIIIGPLVVGPMIWALSWLPAKVFGAPTKLAGTNARRNPGRAAATTAALTIGVTLMSLFTVTQDSVSVTQARWIVAHNPYDYSVDPLSGSSLTVPFGLADDLRARPELAHVAAVDGAKVSLNGTAADVGAVDASAYGSLFKPVVRSGSIAEFTPGTVALSNELASSLKLRVGDSVTIPTAGPGPVTSKIAMIYQVYTGHGVDWYDVLMTRPDFLRAFAPTGDTQVRVLAAPGVSVVASRAAVDAVVAGNPNLQVGSLAEKKSSLTGSADATLSLFTAMLGLAIVIAVLGIANTLSLSVVERTRESALLRALGLSRGQMRRMLSVEAVLMSAVGALLGVALGISVAWAVEVLIGRVEGGSVLSVPVLKLAGYVVLASIAGLLAAVLPGRRAASVSIVAAIADA